MKALLNIGLLLILVAFAGCDPRNPTKSRLDPSVRQLTDLNNRIVEAEQRQRQGLRITENKLQAYERELEFIEFQMEMREERSKSFFQRIASVVSPKPDTIVVNGRQQAEELDVIDRYEFIYIALHGAQEEDMANLRGQVSSDFPDSSAYYMNHRLHKDSYVFGWHPHWMNGAWRQYNFNLLSTISYFAYDINPKTGSYRKPEVIQEFKKTAMIDSAKKAGCNVLLTVSNHGSRNNELFLSDPVAQETMIDSLMYLLRYRDIDGVDIDFEVIPLGYRVAFTAFMNRLYNRLADGPKEYIISLSLPAADLAAVYDIPLLNNWVDLFVIMGYDLHHQKSKMAGPIAPIRTGDVWNASFSLSSGVAQYMQDGMPRNKTILALPYYGAIWETNSDAMGADNKGFVTYLTYKEIESYYDRDQYPRKLDEVSYSKYFVIKDSTGDSYQQCWYEDSATIDYKIDWIQRQGLKGTGVWALGYDNGMTDLWGVIVNRYGEGSPDLKDAIRARKRFAFISLIRKYQYPIIAAALFILIFMVMGFMYSLSDWRVRDSLFYGGSSRALYAALLFAFIIGILTYTGILYDKTLIMVGGLFLGLVITFLINRVTVRWRRELP